MTENEHPITEALILQYLQGNLEDAALHAKVEAWLSVEENRLSARNTYKAWELSMLTAPSRQNPAEAFARLQNKLNKNKNKGNGPGSGTIISLWWYAAAAVILIIGAFVLFQKDPPEEMTILAAMDQVQEFALEDGSMISIDQHSSIVYDKKALATGETRTVLLDGQAFFEIAHDPNRPFIVLTHDARIQVLGTKFMVKTTDHTPTKVLVTEGKVQVHYLNTPTNLTLTAEQETNGGTENASDPLVQPSDDNQLYWKTGVMAFENASLGHVLETLSQEFGTDIRAQNEQILSCTITATFKKQSLETIIEVLTSIHQLESTVEGNSIVIFGDGCK